MRRSRGFKSLLVPSASAITAAITAAIVTAVLVVTFDDDDATTVVPAPLPAAPSATPSATATPAVADAAPSSEPRASADPNAADAAALESKPAVLGTSDQGARAAAAPFDPVRLFQDVSPSVVAVRVGLGGGGSGFFVDTEGHIVTAYRQVRGALAVDVVTADGTELIARVLGFDRVNDVAVLAVDPTGLAIGAVTLADSDTVRVGDPLAVIGTPFGLPTSLTTGVVSAIERTLPGPTVGGRPQRRLIQTDAAINPGNAGGVLINAAGEVIGMTAGVVSPVGANVGVAFAIPSNILRRFLPRMIAGEQVRHPWMGLAFLEDPQEPGLVIASLVLGSPADRAGLRPGDRLIGLNGDALAEFTQLARTLDESDVGDILDFEVARGARTFIARLELVASPG